MRKLESIIHEGCTALSSKHKQQASLFCRWELSSWALTGTSTITRSSMLAFASERILGACSLPPIWTQSHTSRTHKNGLAMVLWWEPSKVLVPAEGCASPPAASACCRHECTAPRKCMCARVAWRDPCQLICLHKAVPHSLSPCTLKQSAVGNFALARCISFLTQC